MAEAQLAAWMEAVKQQLAKVELQMHLQKQRCDALQEQNDLLRARLHMRRPAEGELPVSAGGQQPFSRVSSRRLEALDLLNSSTSASPPPLSVEEMAQRDELVKGFMAALAGLQRAARLRLLEAAAAEEPAGEQLYDGVRWNDASSKGLDGDEKLPDGDHFVKDVRKEMHDTVQGIHDLLASEAVAREEQGHMIDELLTATRGPKHEQDLLQLRRRLSVAEAKRDEVDARALSMEQRVLAMEATLRAERALNQDLSTKLAQSQEQAEALQKELLGLRQAVGAHQADAKQAAQPSRAPEARTSRSDFKPAEAASNGKAAAAAAPAALEAFLRSIAANDAAAVRSELEADPSVALLVTAEPATGSRALHYAVAQGSTEAALCILECLQRRGEKQRHLFDLHKELFDRSVSSAVDGPDALGRSPLALLMGQATASEGLMVSLLRAKAELSRRDAKGMTPFLECALSGHVNIMKSLLNITRGGVLSEANESGETALHLVGGRGHHGAAELLLKVKADVQATDGQGLTAAEAAEAAGHASVAELLRSGGASQPPL